ncbi:MAG: lysine--tRNA ligase [Dehalococcoidia bacterium]|nr:lysine--tRNA ligase [Dehalococcoidia bacterium]MDW8119653.1 lysine--tRNA ligase [Chloroflexota bacterium]
MPQRSEDLFQARLAKLQHLRAQGIDPYPPRFRRTHTAQQAISFFLQEEAAHGAGKQTAPVRVAGRITALRGMGKATFVDLRDGTGRLQVLLRQDALGTAYTLLKDMDLGDFVGAEGPLFRTRTGEITLEARQLTILCKALRPPPAKWHGLKDVEVRYRQRYLDWLANEPSRQMLVLRHRVVQAIRRFLDQRGFVEVETPILLPVAAGAFARPFVTYHNALDRRLYLRIATELHLKRCIIGGLDKVYEIGRVFRNEGIDIRHNPEFTTLESYEAYADYNDVMRMVEEMISTVAQDVLGTMRVPWGDQQIDFAPPWRRLSLREVVRERTGIDLDTATDPHSLGAEMRRIGLTVDPRASWGKLVDKLLGEMVEPHLIQPTFLVDYPVEMSPLAKRKPDNPRYVERFEAFAGGMEIANAFTELNDPIDQRQRFQEQEALRQQFGDEEFDRLDEDFLLAMEYGMPPTGGLGVGIDRLVMLFANTPSIREVIAFPHLSWSQEELFREVDRRLHSVAERLGMNGQALTVEGLVQALVGELSEDVRSRLTDAELRKRAEAFLARRGTP